MTATRPASDGATEAGTEPIVDDLLVADLWPRVRLGDRDARNELILFYAPLVKWVAGGMRTACLLVGAADVHAWGTIGLIQAIDRYDPDRGVPFVAYAIGRIRGAIGDGVRESDWVKRPDRVRHHEALRATDELVQELGRLPTIDEVGARLGVTRDRFLSRYRGAPAIYLSGMFGDRGRAGGPFVEIADDSPSAADCVVDHENIALVRKLVRRLPDRERQVVALYYVEQLTMVEIGDVMGVTESRVSQIHRHAIAMLRDWMRRTDRLGATA